MRGAPHGGLAWAICLINVSDLCQAPWPTDAFSPRQPSPIETESLAMPRDNSLRFDDNQSLPPTGPPTTLSGICLDWRLVDPGQFSSSRKDMVYILVDPIGERICRREIEEGRILIQRG